MTKKMNNREMGPFGDAEMNGDDPRKDRRRKDVTKNSESKNSSKINKDKQVSQDGNDTIENREKLKECTRREKEKQREREKMERYVRKVAEAERHEREVEFERWEKERSRSRSKHSGMVSRYKPRRPPAGYKDPHEVCKQILPTKIKEKRRQEMKALMNCIAFTPSQTDLTTVSKEDQILPEERKTVAEEIDNSSSSDTTSDITDVTPRSSSSGCSSMSKQSMCTGKIEHAKVGSECVIKSKDENKLTRENDSNVQKSNNKNFSSADDDSKKDNQIFEEEIRNMTEIELEEMKYLNDAFEDMDLDEETSDFASSIISGLSEERRAKCNRKNMTFTNEQLREIERVNLILLKKIMTHRKPRAKPPCQPTVKRKTSAAINRSRMEERIERENKVLLKKLQSAKGTTGTLSRKSSQSAYY